MRLPRRLAPLLLAVVLVSCGGPGVAAPSPQSSPPTSPGTQLGPGGLTLDEEVGAVIVPRPGTHPDPLDIAAFARGLIADFKVPQFVVFREEPLPRNPAGKVLKRELREELVDQAPAGA